jgi:2'-hydroxyisoflavone reductase
MTGWTRRDFLGSSLATGAAMAAGLPAFGFPRSGAKLRILILGGTGFLGPACMEAALAKGHSVTLFNRGRTERRRNEAGRPSVIPEGVEVLRGNRDPKKNADDDNGPNEEKDPDAPKGLSQLEGKKWDVVIDPSGYFPRMVRASAEMLAPNVKQYIFISSVSVYESNAVPDKDESDTVGVLKDPDVEEFGADFSNYGPAKAACEAAAEKAMPGRVANIRAGYIVGPRDTTARFLYWPVRVQKGGEMIVPGKPSDPIQIIDVRDLAEWLVHLAETTTNGVFNATGPAEPLTMLDVVQGCKKATRSDASFTWIDPAELQKLGVTPGSFPIWINPEGEYLGFHKRDVRKAVAAGLKFRSIEDTAKGCLDWYASLPADVQGRVVRLLPAENEAEALKAFTEKKG